MKTSSNSLSVMLENNKKQPSPTTAKTSGGFLWDLFDTMGASFGLWRSSRDEQRADRHQRGREALTVASALAQRAQPTSEGLKTSSDVSSLER